MLNPLETYFEAGRKAALAMNVGDRANSNFHHEWANRASKMEKPDDKRTALAEFDRGYKAGRRV